MAGDIEPIVVPVTATVDRAALQSAKQALGDEVRTAREAGVPPPANAAAAGAEVVSLRAVQQEVRTLAEVARSFNMQVSSFVQAMQAATQAARAYSGARTDSSTTVLPSLATPPPGPTVGAAAAGGGGGAAGGPPPGGAGTGGGAPNLAQILSSAGVATAAGIGLRRAYAEALSMATRSRSLEESAFLASMAGNESGGVTQRTIDELLSGGGRRPLTRPGDATEIMRELRARGARPSAADAQLLADYGLTALGSPSAAGGFATNLYRDTGSERALAILTSLRDYSRDTGIGTKDLVEQFAGLTRFFAALHGTRSLTPDEERDRMQTVAYLNSLPGGMGRGERGVELEQNVRGATQGGPGFWMAVQAFRDESGMDPFTSFEGMHRFRLWQRSDRLLPAVERMSGRWGGGDPFATAFLREEYAGFTPEQAEAFRTGRRGRAGVGIYGDADARERAARALGDADDPGARSLTARIEQERGLSTQTPLNRAQEFWERLRGAYPIATGAGESIAAGVGLWGGYSGFRRARRLFDAIRTRTAAGARMGPSAAGAGLLSARAAMRLGLYGAGAYGVGAFGKDVYDAAAGGDPTNRRDLWAGGIGAAIGGTLGFLTPLPGGALLGASAGYGLAKTLFGGATTAEAAVPPAGTTDRMGAAVGGDGWRREDVDEHLALLRSLSRFSAVPGTEPVTAGDAGELPASATGAPSVRAWRSGRWGSGRIRADDPRIAAAASKYHLPLALMLGAIDVESKFHPDAVSPKGAIGLMQLMPDTARDLGVDPYTVEGNLEGGARYLRRQIDRFGGDLPRALTAYNRGPGNTNDRTVAGSDYDDRVLARAMAWRTQIHRLQDRVADATSGEPRAARREREIVERVLGPDDQKPAEVIVHLQPGAGFEDLIQPSRAVVPGARTRR